MLNVTSNALDLLGSVLDRRNAPEDVALRLVEATGSFEVKLDRERTGDAGYSKGDRTVLVVDRELSSQLDGQVLDAVNAGGETQLTLARAEPEKPQ